MLFSSLPFLFYFLPCALGLYFLAPRRLKNAALLLCSLVFYAWGEPRFVLFMAAAILQGYTAARLMERYPARRRLLLTLSAVLSLGLLGYCKYADFLISGFNAVTGLSVPLLRITLPIGISFYTFQILSYVIDVYRGDAPAQRSLIDLAAYIAMFPQLVAGPIVRYTDVAPQLQSRTHTVQDAALGARRFVLGLGKKVLLVDLDPQGNSTSGYGINKRSAPGSVYECLLGQDAKENIQSTQYHVDLLPSNTALAGASIELVELPRRESRLRAALAPVIPEYDYIFIDCPPSLDLLTLNGLCACDTVLIPIQCEFYALEGLSELMSTLRTVRKKYNAYLDVEGVVFTMYAGRLNLTIQVVEQVKKYFGDKVYKTCVPRTVRLSEAPSYGMPINYYEPNGKGSEAYMEMARELLKNNQR